jgi:hypothetical protein
MDTTILVVYWLLSGEPAFDFRPRSECLALQTLTRNMGGVELELADGTKLGATRIDCLTLREPPQETCDDEQPETAQAR